MSSLLDTLRKYFRAANYSNFEKVKIVVDNKLLKMSETKLHGGELIKISSPVMFSRDPSDSLNFYISDSRSHKVDVTHIIDGLQLNWLSPYYMHYKTNTIEGLMTEEHNKVMAGGNIEIQQRYFDLIDNLSNDSTSVNNHPLAYRMTYDRYLNTIFLTSPIFRQISNNYELYIPNAKVSKEELDIHRSYFNTVKKNYLTTIFLTNYVLEYTRSFPLLITRKLHSSKRDPISRMFHQSRNEVRELTGGYNFLHLFYENANIKNPFHCIGELTTMYNNSVLESNNNHKVFRQAAKKQGELIIQYEAITVLSLCQLLGITHKVGFSSASAVALITGLLVPSTSLDMSIQELRFLPLAGESFYLKREDSVEGGATIHTEEVPGSVPVSAMEFWLSDQYHKMLLGSDIPYSRKEFIHMFKDVQDNILI